MAIVHGLLPRLKKKAHTTAQKTPTEEINLRPGPTMEVTLGCYG